MRFFFSIFLLLSLILFSPENARAQESTCSGRLREAREKYDAGLVQEVPGLLIDCIKSGFSGDERLQAFKLLINAYIFDEDLRMADSTMLIFLKTFPDYKVSSSDSPEFTSLLEQYDNRPRGALGFFAGINMPMIKVIEPFGVQDPNRVTGKYHSAGPGFRLGMDYYIFIRPNLEFNLEPMFMRYKFRYTVNPFPFTEVRYEESQNRVGLPLSLIYCFQGGRIRPYIRAGVAATFLLSAKSDISRSYQNTGDFVFPPVPAANLPVTDQRNRIDLLAMLGAGIRYKINYSNLFLDIRYNVGLRDQVLNSIRNNGNDEFIWKYYYIPDRFSLDNISVSIGLAKTLYHPKQK